MPEPKLIVIGAGGFAREAAWAASGASKPWEVIGFCDDNTSSHGQVLNGVPVLGGLDRLADYPTARVVIAIGNPRTRRAVVAKLGDTMSDRFATVIHASAQVSADASIAAGSIICANVSITCQVTIGAHSIVNLNSTIGHDTVIGDYCTLAPLVGCSGAVTLGDGVEIGTGAVVRQGISVDDGGMLGMGGVLTKDVGVNELWLGNPAAYRRDLPVWGMPKKAAGA